ncbi:MAG TPA: hypothetical protein VGS10_01720 [Terracidiphilus sp.]|nr:hypothetical protein [Terracidiphilus sp.]
MLQHLLHAFAVGIPGIFQADKISDLLKGKAQFLSAADEFKIRDIRLREQSETAARPGSPMQQSFALIKADRVRTQAGLADHIANLKECSQGVLSHEERTPLSRLQSQVRNEYKPGVKVTMHW